MYTSYTFWDVAAFLSKGHRGNSKRGCYRWLHRWNDGHHTAMMIVVKLLCLFLTVFTVSTSWGHLKNSVMWCRRAKARTNKIISKKKKKAWAPARLVPDPFFFRCTSNNEDFSRSQTGCEFEGGGRALVKKYLACDSTQTTNLSPPIPVYAYRQSWRIVQIVGSFGVQATNGDFAQNQSDCKFEGAFSPVKGTFIGLICTYVASALSRYAASALPSRCVGFCQPAVPRPVVRNVGQVKQRQIIHACAEYIALLWPETRVI